MSTILKAVGLLIMCTVTFAGPAACAAWAPDGVALCQPAYWQGYPAMVSDGMGGAIVAWSGERTVGTNVYAQRISGAGLTSWGTDGAAVCTAPNAQDTPVLVGDGAGGAIVVWHDIRSLNWDIYAQRVDAAGAAQWAADGVAICAAPGDQTDPLIASDGFGGAIIAWVDGRSGGIDIYAQRIDSSGVSQWAQGGAAVCVAPGASRLWSLIADGAGGAIMAWHDPRSGTNHAYCQRLDGTGTALWAANGIALSSMSWGQMYPVAASDGASGAIFAWQDYRSGNADVYAQHVNAAGIMQWAANGVALCAVPGNVTGLSIMSDGASGAFVSWADSRVTGPAGIYAQKVDASGVVMWAADGVAVGTVPDHLNSARLAPDGSDGVIVVWTDAPNNMEILTGDIYGQRMNGTGAPQWGANGVAICVASGDQSHPCVIPDGNGGAIVTWLDFRTPGWASYAQRVRADGELGGYVASVCDAGAFAMESLPNPFNPRTTIKYDLPEAGSVRLAVFDLAGRLVRTLMDENKSPGSYEAVWDGRDSSGREVSSGTYLARLEFGGRVETVRMGLVR